MGRLFRPRYAGGGEHGHGEEEAVPGHNRRQDVGHVDVDGSGLLQEGDLYGPPYQTECGVSEGDSEASKNGAAKAQALKEVDSWRGEAMDRQTDAYAHCPGWFADLNSGLMLLLMMLQGGWMVRDRCILQMGSRCKKLLYVLGESGR